MKSALLFTKSIRIFLKNIATLWFIGYLPYAPGTWGSLAGLIFVLSAKWALTFHPLIIVVAGIVIGIIASHVAERVICDPDSPYIIIDEFMGFLVAVYSIPHSYGYLVMAFLLFRFFDILKPLAISKLERTLSGGLGIMADDILAGIYTNIIIHLWTKIF